MVRVTYNADRVTAKGRAPMKMFIFEQDKKDTVAVSGVDFTPADTEELNGEDEAPNYESQVKNYSTKKFGADLEKQEPGNKFNSDLEARAARQADTLAILNKAKNKTA